MEYITFSRVFRQTTKMYDEIMSETVTAEHDDPELLCRLLQLVLGAALLSTNNESNILHSDRITKLALI